MKALRLVGKFSFVALIFWSAHFRLAAQDSGSMLITIEGLRNNKGILYITLYNSPEGFPDDAVKAFAWKKLEITNYTGVFRFDNLAPGNYAFSILHDENSNGRMEKNFLGIPREGFAFSNNYSPRISSPSFRDAAFTFDGKSLSLKVKAIYY
jgi:uncharacterized protein (DUF2141 family)